MSQERIADAKVVDAKIITDIDKDVFEGRRQDVPSHRTFTSKEKHLDVTFIWRHLEMADRTMCRHQDVEGDYSKDAPISYHVHINTIQIRPLVWVTMYQGGDIHRHNGRVLQVRCLQLLCTIIHQWFIIHCRIPHEEKYSRRSGNDGVHWQCWGYGTSSLWHIQGADLKGHGFHEIIPKARDRLTYHQSRSPKPIEGWRRDKINAQEVVSCHSQKEGPTQVMVLQT